MQITYCSVFTIMVDHYLQEKNCIFTAKNNLKSFFFVFLLGIYKISFGGVEMLIVIVKCKDN